MIFSFSIKISPEEGGIKPPNIFKKVDLPEPDSPIIATNSPFSISTETPLSISTFILPIVKVFFTSVALIILNKTPPLYTNTVYIHYTQY